MEELLQNHTVKWSQCFLSLSCEQEVKQTKIELDGIMRWFWSHAFKFAGRVPLVK